MAARARVGIIRAEYNPEITASLETWCIRTLRQSGVPARNIARHSVPGCFEIPVVAQELARKKRFDVLIALGAIIRGDTHHFDLIANECARGVMQVSLEFGIPVIFEVLAAYNRRDTLRRAANNGSNKGVEAAHAALFALAAMELAKTS
jgi:6,7-dimethyl-8-ribityllumazine synthase